MPGPMEGCFEPSPVPEPVAIFMLDAIIQQKLGSTHFRLPDYRRSWPAGPGRVETSVVCGSEQGLLSDPQVQLGDI